MGDSYVTRCLSVSDLRRTSMLLTIPSILPPEEAWKASTTITAGATPSKGDPLQHNPKWVEHIVSTHLGIYGH
jgi:hypothetical protein